MKQIKREEKKKEKIQEKETVDKLYNQYKHFNENQIHNLVISLTNLENDLGDSKEAERQAIKRVIEDKLYSKNKQNISDESSFSYYPDFTDNNFNVKIFKKKEFNDNKISFDNFNIDEIAEERCNNDKFELSGTQNFIKNFISPETPYNSILLFYGTGVGKTCSAISIAEQFKKKIRNLGKKIIVLLSPSIKDNFKRKIFNIDKLDLNNLKKKIPQCTGIDYLEELDLTVLTEKEQFRRKINKVINKYYQFFGYDEFAYYVEKLEESICQGFPKNKHLELKKKIIESKFSDTVFIIDEAHNIRITGDNSTKISPPIIERVIKYSKNTKLVLLSATPMYNSMKEIVWIINLLLQNDNRPIIYNNEVFDKYGELKENGLEIIIKKSRGYISYMRGENPYSFPFRLYPDINEDSKILNTKLISKRKMNGILIEKEKRIKYLKLIGSEMSEFQFEQYQNSVSFLMKINKNKKENKGYSELEKGLQVSNIVYPCEEEGKVLYGNEGIKSIFNIDNGKSYKYKPGILNKYGNILDLDLLGNYSCKMKTIIEYINNSEGIVYIYSQFITSGILPLALALEQNGYKKYGSSNDQLLNLPEYSENKKYCKRKPISYQGLKRSEYKNKQDFMQASYILISGNQNISKNNDYEINRSTLKDNKEGKFIKVILGSPLAGEGLDLKGIREVHILDPWHHLNKMSQVIGRAIRNCSHYFLPLNKRNCTVFLHSAVTFNVSKKKSNKKDYYERESIDLRIYRKAELKSLQISKIEKHLKINAIDCHINKEGNIFLQEKWGEKISIITSQKKKVNYIIGDKPYSKNCNFEKECDYKCNPKIENKNIIEVDTDTYSFNFAKKNMDFIINIIKDLFKKDFVYTLEEIVNKVKHKKKFSDILIYKTIDHILKKKIILVDKYETTGYLIYRGGYYLFHPENIKDENLPYYNRTKPLPNTVFRIPLNKNYYVEEIQRNKRNKNIFVEKENTFNSIELQIKKKASEVAKIYDFDFYWKDKKEIFKEIEIEKILDRLSNINKSLLLYTIIIDYNNMVDKNQEIKFSNNFRSKIFNYFYSDFLFVNKHLYYGEKIWKDNKKIFGFRLANYNNTYDYFCLNNKNKYEKCQTVNLKHIKKSLKMIPKEEKRPESNIYGFMDRMNNPRINVFKIVDKRYRKSSGARCEQINSKKEIGDIINILLNKKKYILDKKGIPFNNNGKIIKKDKNYMCSEMETLLRMKEKLKKEKMFYTSNEIIN